MGHEDESLDEFVETMYFPTRNAYGLSSVAGNKEKLAALQNEYENMKTRLEAEREKALRLEKKVNAYGHCWHRTRVLPSVAEARTISSITQDQWSLVGSSEAKGDMGIQQLIINYRALAIQQEEIAAKNRTLELAEAATKQAAMLNSEPSEPVTSDEHGNSMPVGSSDKKVLEQQMDVDSENGNAHEASGAIPSSPDGNNQNGAPVLTEDSINRGDIVSTVGVAVKIKVNDASVDGDAGDVVMRTEIMVGLASVEGESIQERADGFDKADVIQVSNGGDDKVNQMKDEGKLPVIDVDLTDSE
ncbi:hypothetical protein DKX38_029073 [Salix brachista]|uniref:Uncharacterized protein n=1 Tax=Salix brachista TaxID=2182728 RepID=A0A5N5J308_9ROSI|nr:hypothetical protein DKX38_029073 [Salix brachista]